MENSKENTWFWNNNFSISNEEMNDIVKIVQALEDSNISLKGVTETNKIETKEQKGGFLSMLLGTLGASLLGILLTGKGIVRAGEGIVRAGYGTSIMVLQVVVLIQRTLIDFTSLFSPYDFKKNDKIIFD